MQLGNHMFSTSEALAATLGLGKERVGLYQSSEVESYRLGTLLAGRILL